MEKKSRNIWFIVAIFMTVWFSFGFFSGERIFHNGLGGDGRLYAEFAQRPFEYIKNPGVDNYHVVRLLPPLIVHLTSKIIGYQLGTDIKEPHAVINIFLLFNFFLIIGSVFILYLIAKHLKWNPPVLMVCFTALFINFPILKISVYNPTITDVFAFMFGLLILYVYMKNWRIVLFIISAFACFVWPTFIYTSLPLFLFKFNKIDIDDCEPKPFSNVVSIVVAVFLTVGIIYDYYFNGFRLTPGATQVNEKIIIVSVILFFMYIWFMLRPFIDRHYFKKSILSNLNLYGLLPYAALFIFVKYFVYTFSTGTHIITPLLQIRLVGQSMIVNPLVNVVAHVSYFGPVVILTLLFWKPVVSVAKRYGPGLILVLIFSALFSISTESRQSMAAWPLFAVLTCDALNQRGVTWRMSYSLLCLSLLASRFWLSLNPISGEWSGGISEFPYQMVFMNFGPWLSSRMYLVFAFVTLILFIWVSLSMRRIVFPGSFFSSDSCGESSSDCGISKL